MHGSRHTVNGKLVDDADFTDDGDEGLGGFDFDLSEVAAFGHLLAGFIGSVPHKSVLASGSAALPSGNVPSANAKAYKLIAGDARGCILGSRVGDAGLAFQPALS